jgi:hypothetical protein
MFSKFLFLLAFFLVLRVNHAQANQRAYLVLLLVFLVFCFVAGHREPILFVLRVSQAFALEISRRMFSLLTREKKSRISESTYQKFNLMILQFSERQVEVGDGQWLRTVHWIAREILKFLRARRANEN